MESLKELINQYHSLQYVITIYEEEEQRRNALCANTNREVNELEKEESRLINNYKYLLGKKLKTLTIFLSIVMSILVFGIASVCWSLDYAIFFGVPLSLGSGFLSYLGLSLYNLLRQENKNIFKSILVKRKNLKI